MQQLEKICFKFKLNNLILNNYSILIFINYKKFKISDIIIQMKQKQKNNKQRTIVSGKKTEEDHHHG